MAWTNPAFREPPEDAKRDIVRLQRLSGALELPFLDFIRETEHAATTFLWRPDNPGLHQDNLKGVLKPLARIREALRRFDAGEPQEFERDAGYILDLRIKKEPIHDNP